MTAHIRYWLWTNALQCDGTKVAWGLQRKIWENTSWSPHPPIVTVWPWPRHPQLQKCCMTIKDATFEQWLRLQLAMLQLHIGIVTWCWPLWGPLCSPFDPLLRVGRFTQTHLPFWMTVPGNGPISSSTPSHPKIFPLSCPITFSPPLQNCFNFGVVGWPPPCSWGGCRFMVKATAS